MKLVSNENKVIFIIMKYFCLKKLLFKLLLFNYLELLTWSLMIIDNYWLLIKCGNQQNQSLNINELMRGQYIHVIHRKGNHCSMEISAYKIWNEENFYQDEFLKHPTHISKETWEKRIYLQKKWWRKKENLAKMPEMNETYQTDT